MFLALVAEIDPAVPVLSLKTGWNFPETLAYRHALTDALGLTDVREISPLVEAVTDCDPG